MKKKQSSTSTIKVSDTITIPQATVKEAVQKRNMPPNHSSVIPGINVNELKHSLDLLKYALDYSDAIVDTVQVPLIVLNKKLEVLTANRAFYDTFKLTPKETENQVIYHLNSNAWNIPKLTLLLEKILPDNNHFENYEVKIDSPHIGKRIMLLNARRTYRQVNSTEAILLAFEDVTDRRLLEKQKDDFVGIVSHELKTPLTSVKVFLELLEKHHKQSRDEKGMFYISKMESQMERLTQLMASFVNVYKIQNGKLDLNKSKFDIDQLVRSLVSDFQYITKTHVIEYTGQGKIVVYADKDRIFQVITNLVSNAIKYSPDSKNILIKSVKDKSTVTVSVKDFGFGISKEEQKKVFDRFFRVKRRNRNAISGLGLGLYISYEIINQHGGKIWIESEENKGSTFNFSLPIKEHESM